jgi:hypothetical protein
VLVLTLHSYAKAPEEWKRIVARKVIIAFPCDFLPTFNWTRKVIDVAADMQQRCV